MGLHVRVCTSGSTDIDPLLYFPLFSTRGKRRDHHRHHRLHPPPGYSGQCALLSVQERQNSLRAFWQTGNVSVLSNSFDQFLPHKVEE